MKQSLVLTLTGLALLALSACASSKIQKVVNGEAVGPSGMRFYRPRPYVAVNEPFPVDARSFLLSGRVTPDGKFVQLDLLDPEHSERKFLAERLALTSGATSRIESSAIRFRKSSLGSSEESATEPSTDEVEVDADVGEGDGESTPTKVVEQTGLMDLKVSNDNAAFAITPLKRYFDILWLPDFDEDYVVQAEAGFGNASISMQLGQGWSMQGLEAKIDNSSWTDRVLGLVDEGTKILTDLTRGNLGLVPSFGGDAAPASGEEAATEGGVPQLIGTAVTVKVTFVRMAAPGLYPILKPQELEAIRTTDQSPETARRILIPVAPFTNIAFNTYELIVVEAARAEGDTPTRFHQYLDLEDNAAPSVITVSGGGNDTPGGSDSGTQPDLENISQSLNEAFPSLEIALSAPISGLAVGVRIRHAAGSRPGAELVQEVLQLLADKLEEASIELNPPGLDEVAYDELENDSDEELEEVVLEDSEATGDSN